jgi:hypothetical protein
LLRFAYIALLPIALTAGAAASGQALKTETSGEITEITLERTWCYGVCPIDKLVLRADGTAMYTAKANTQRTGQFTGTFWKEEFSKLAQWLVSRGFFELKGSYGNANVDTATQVLRVARRGEQKSVVNNTIGGSETLWGMQRVIQGVVADIPWQPVRSGIRGVTRPNEIVLIHPSDDKQEFIIRAGGNGTFEIALMPGTYKVEPLVFGRSPQVANPPRTNPTQTVVVQPDQFANAK